MTPVIGPTGNYICPYCGKIYNINKVPLTRDHIVLRSFWGLVQVRSKKFERIKKGNVGMPCVNDSRNIILVCGSCNRSKSNTLAVPSWSIYSIFRYWDINQLRSYAEYFYYWSECFLEDLEITVTKYKDDKYLSIVASEAERDTRHIEDFKKEYQTRLKVNDWFIGG